MKENEDKIHFERIIAAIDRIENHLRGFKLEGFKNDKKTYDAVLMQLVNIGEMVNRLSDNFREEHSDFPWHEAVGMRNQITHGYFEIDAEEIWQTAKQDLPELRIKIEKILK